MGHWCASTLHLCYVGLHVQMENIQLFLNFCENYGVPKTGLFQTVDLFEGRNMPQVLNCIQMLGSEASLSYGTLELQRYL